MSETDHDYVYLATSRDAKHIEITVCNSQGQPSYEAQYGSWRQQLTDLKAPKNGRPFLSTFTPNAFNARVIQDTWAGRIKYEDQLTELTLVKCLMNGEARKTTSKIHAEWAIDRIVPDSNIEIHEDFPLKDYQRVPVVASRMLPGYGLFMEQGTGKTPVAISRICTDARELRNSGETRMLRVLIICPKNLRLNWQYEIDKFSTVSHRHSVLRGGPAQRVKALAQSLRQETDEHFTATIVSYGLAVQAWDRVISHVPWDIVIVDEAHAFKAPKTDRAAVMFKVRDCTSRRLALTGTPVTNTALDLWALLEFLEPGCTGHATFESFKKMYGVFSKSRDGKRDVLEYVQNMPAIKRLLAEMTFIVRKDEVLKDLPVKQYDVYEVELSKKQEEAYRSIASKLYIEIENDLENAENEGARAMVMNNALVKLMKLAQITSGFLIFSEERDEFGEVTAAREVVEYDDNPKLDALIELLKTAGPLDKTIVWSCWRKSIDMISSRLAAEGIDFVTFYGGTSEDDRRIAVERYNGDPRCRVFLGNPEAGGAGLTLLGYMPGVNDADGTNTTWTIYYDQSYKPVLRWQSEDRPHRVGTRVVQRITDLCVPGTIDEDIRARVLDKKKNAMDVQDLRAILSSIARSIE